MSAKKTDISQIRKYLNGELDARAMHQLEREAQDDPFLMDAIAGYENAGTAQQPHLNELDQRLQQRIDQSKVRRLIPWKYYAVAASVLIVFTLGYLLWPAGHPPVLHDEMVTAKLKTPLPADHSDLKADTVLNVPDKASLIAANTPPPAARSTTSGAQLKPAAPVNAPLQAEAQLDEPAPVGKPAVPPAEAAKKTTGNRGLALAQDDSAANTSYPNTASMALSRRAKDSVTLKEVTIKGYDTQKKTTLTGSATTANTQLLQGKLAGVQVTTPNLISGIVMNQMGIPLPGVNVMIKGTQTGTLTDTSGHFAVSAKERETLALNYIGYNHKEVKADAGNNLKITLKESAQSLNEVVVVGYGKPVKPDKNPHPQTGWDNYNQYLKRAAIAGDGTTGTVRLSFTVNEQGRLAGFKILSGLNDAANKQAINLVKDGPAWVPAAGGKPQTIKLKIHFGKE